MRARNPSSEFGEAATVVVALCGDAVKGVAVGVALREGVGDASGAGRNAGAGVARGNARDKGVAVGVGDGEGAEVGVVAGSDGLTRRWRCCCCGVAAARAAGASVPNVSDSRRSARTKVGTFIFLMDIATDEFQTDFSCNV